MARRAGPSSAHGERDALPLHFVRLRVALTGASGYTGGRLLAALRARGRRGGRARPRRARSPTPIRPRASSVVEGDLGDARRASTASSPAQDAVLHVAAVYRTAGHPDSYYREVNVRRHRAAARGGGAPRRAPLRPHLDGRRPRPRRSTLRPTRARPSRRATSTRRRRRRRRRWPSTTTAARGVPVAVVRPGAIYGPGETRLLKLFRAIARGRYAIVGSGRTFYHPVYIDDLVAGFLLALDRPEAVGEAFLDLRAELRLAARARRARREAHGRPRAAVPDPGARRSSGRATSSRRSACRSGSSRRCTGGASTSGPRAGRSRSRRRGGCSATTRRSDLDEGIARTAAWYREAGWL